MNCGIMVLDGIPTDIKREGNLFSYISAEGTKYKIEGLPNDNTIELLDKQHYVEAIVYEEIGNILGVILYKDKFCILLNEFEAEFRDYSNLNNKLSDKFSINLSNEII